MNHALFRLLSLVLLLGACLPLPVAAQGLLERAGTLATSSSSVQPGPRKVDKVEAELVAERAALVPGELARLALRLKHEPHWHTYWRNAGDSGLPTQLRLQLPPGLEAGPLQWPAPMRIAVGPLANYGYEGEVLLPFDLRVAPDLAVTGVRIEAQAQWLVCREVCIPGEARLVLDLPVARDAAGVSPSRWAPLFERTRATLPTGPASATVAHAREGGVSLVFEGRPARAEFFPYGEGAIRPVAPQRLLHLDDGRARLDLDAGEQPATLAQGGLLVMDGRPVELRLQQVATAAPAGRPVSVATAAGGAPAAPALDAFTLATVLLSGLAGGLVLNLMPCVFPVIGLKLMGFVQDAGGDARSARRQAWWFAAGVLAAFLALAGVLVALRLAGETAGWGFQLQSPPFVAAMALLFVLVGLNFAGVYEVGLGLTRLQQAPAGMRPHGTSLGAFGAGLLAAAVATPCTAPFMGSAVGFTLGQPPAVLVAVLAAIGIGMALPYVALAHAPALMRRLPRPGRWMESLRQFLAFPMFATAVWLAWVLGLQAGLDALLRLGLAAVLLATAAWVYGRFVQRAAGLGRAGRSAAVALGLLAGTALLLWPLMRDEAPDAVQASEIDWQPWSEARVAEARAAGRTVFVDFTAAWCISCQANKKLVLDAPVVREAFARAGVVALRADWTRRDEAITRALAALGRNGVPVYQVWRGGADAPVLLPELLDRDTVVAAVAGRP